MKKLLLTLMLVVVSNSEVALSAYQDHITQVKQ
jgi:hypothetical protein